jgi:alpha-L-arabinofuranosidase
MRYPILASFERSLFFACLLIADMAAVAQQTEVGDEYKGVDVKAAVAMKKASPVEINIDEDRIVKKFSKEMFGYNYVWIWINRMTLSKNSSGGSMISPQYLKLMQGFPMPLNRVSGSGSKVFKWKHAIGPVAKRKPQKLAKWVPAEIQKAGPVEWIKSVLAIDKNARFTWTFNIDTDSVKDNVDLVEFLTGDPARNPGGGVNWAAKRVELGLKAPVNIAVWELGNEMDWGETRSNFPIEKYVAKCKEIIVAVKKEFPNAKFAAHAATAPSNKIHKKAGGWNVWHRKVLKELGGQIDFCVVHPYYHVCNIPRLERDCINVLAQDIKNITGSDRIKIYISEHAKWPLYPKKGSGRKWTDNWYQTHSLEGCLTTAEWTNRMLNIPAVTMMAYHSFSGGPWGMIYLDQKTGKLYTTGMFDMFKLLNSIPGINVVQSAASGKKADVKRGSLSFTVSAVSTADGLDLILVNCEPETPREATFSFKGKYYLTEADTLFAPGMDSYNTLKNRPIKVAKKRFSGNGIFTQYNVPAKSLVVLRLKKIKKP